MLGGGVDTASATVFPGSFRQAEALAEARLLHLFGALSAYLCLGWGGGHNHLGWPLIAPLSIWKVIRSYLKPSANSGKCNLRDISSEVQISLALEGFKGPLEAWGLLQVFLLLCKPAASWAGVKRLGRVRDSLGNGREGETTPR